MNVLDGFKELKAEIEQTLLTNNKKINKLLIALRRDSVYSELSPTEEASADAKRAIYRETLQNTQAQVIILNNHLNRVNANIESLVVEKTSRRRRV
jgi:hypothetical protein